MHGTVAQGRGFIDTKPGPWLAARSRLSCRSFPLPAGTLCLALVPEPELGRRIYTHWALLCSSQAQQEAEEEQAQEQAQGQGRGRGRSQGPRPFAAPVPSPPAAPGAALGLPPPAVAHARLQRLQRESQALGLFAQTFWWVQVQEAGNRVLALWAVWAIMDSTVRQSML